MAVTTVTVKMQLSLSWFMVNICHHKDYTHETKICKQLNVFSVGQHELTSYYFVTVVSNIQKPEPDVILKDCQS